MAAIVAMTYEELLPAFAITGNCAVYEGSGGAFPPTDPMSTVIQTNQQWFVHFDWATSGLLNYILAGSWELQVHLEQIGAGEFGLPGNVATVPFVSAPNSYHRDITIPAGVVPEGVYKLVTTIRMKGPGNIPGPIAAFGEGAMLQFYKVGP